MFNFMRVDNTESRVFIARAFSLMNFCFIAHLFMINNLMTKFNKVFFTVILVLNVLHLINIDYEMGLKNEMQKL